MQSSYICREWGGEREELNGEGNRHRAGKQMKVCYWLISRCFLFCFATEIRCIMVPFISLASSKLSPVSLQTLLINECSIFSYECNDKYGNDLCAVPACAEETAIANDSAEVNFLRTTTPQSTAHTLRVRKTDTFSHVDLYKNKLRHKECLFSLNLLNLHLLPCEIWKSGTSCGYNNKWQP